MSQADRAVHVVAAELQRVGDALVALNNAAVPAVNAITAQDLAGFAAVGNVLCADVGGGGPHGLLVLLPPGVAYDSANYAWFSERYSQFLYVDRIVVDPATRGAGIGRALYHAAFDAVRAANAPFLLAEVNTRPPNPGSHVFHARMGFKPLVERENPSSGKRVMMLERPV